MKDLIEVSWLWSWDTLEVNHLNYEKVLESDVIHLVSGFRCGTSSPSSSPTSPSYSTTLKASPLSPVSSLTGHLLTALQAGQFSQLVRISIRSTDLRYVEPDLFRVVATLQDCDLASCLLREKQLSTIFSILRYSEDLKLRTHDISGVNLSSLEPGLLQAVVRLDSICLEETQLTSQQEDAILKSVEETSLMEEKLRVLQLSNVEVKW